MAANNDGVWNEAGAAWSFTIVPAYYQTLWFQALCVFAGAGMLWLLHRLRLRQMAQQFNMRMEERIGERTRIARDLHDTLLQSFQGVLLKFHAVTYMIRSRPEEAEQALGRVIEQARAAITEGRDAVQGLRSSTLVNNDLAQAITIFGDGLSADHAGKDCPELRVCKSRAHREIWLRWSATKSIGSRSKHCGTRSATRTRNGSKWRSTTTNGSFSCGSGTTDKALTKRFLAKAAAPDTTACRACRSARSSLAASWVSGAESMTVRRWS